MSVTWAIPGGDCFSFGLPLQDLEIHDEDCIQHRNQQQSDECCYRQSPDLRVAERLPERPPMEGQGNSARTVAPTVIITGRSG